MQKTFCLFALVTALCSCTSSKVVSDSNALPNALTAQEKRAGWQLLFDGTTTNGWHSYGYNSIKTNCKVADRSIYLYNAKDSKENESKDVLTNDEFSNFDFKADWKISRNGNSGILFYVHEDKAKYKETYFTGPEMQVLDNAGHPDAKIIKHRAGDLYDLISSSVEPVKPAGEWNHVEIIANKGKLDFFLNNIHIINTSMWNDNWRKLIANSKFKSMPDFGTFKTGRIALQNHGNDVWFRNIKIKRL